MPAGNVPPLAAGLAVGGPQVLGLGRETAIDSHVYGAPGGRIFYVDPNNPYATDGGNTGQDPTVPLRTVAAAIALCAPYAGDRIVVGANDAWAYGAHIRQIAIQESVVIPATKGGISISALATNPLGCTWTPAAGSSNAITVYACDVLIEGFVFYPGALANCTGIFVEWNSPASFGDNLTVRNCFFEHGLDYGIRMDYAWYCQIYDNYFEGIKVAAIQSADIAGDADYCDIHDNEFYNCFAAIDLEDVSGCFIYNNRIMGDGTGANNFIDLTGGDTCLVNDNWLACTIAQYDVTCSDSTSGAWVRNHCIDGDTAANPI